VSWVSKDRKILSGGAVPLAYGTSSGSTQSASVTVGGPAFGFAGSSDVLVYWDSIYNSFMFAFAPIAANIVSANEKAAPHQALALVAAGKTFTTSARADGTYRFYGVPSGQANLLIEGKDVPVTIQAQQA
jgi:hypothetical protein